MTLKKIHSLVIPALTLIISCSVVAISPGDKSHFCRHLNQLGGGKKPGFVAVIAHKDEDITWASQLPMPSIVYELDSNSSVTSFPLETVPAAFIQYMIDYYDCLPPWTLFLSSRGRNSFSGSGMDRGGSGAVTKNTQGYGGAFAAAAAKVDSLATYHSIPPAISSAVLDVALMDRGFVSVNHLSASQLSSTHPATLGFSSHSPVGSHRMAFISEEEKKRGCSCVSLRAFLPGEIISCERPWGWPLGGEFWVRSQRITNKPLEFWHNAISVLTHGLLSDQKAVYTKNHHHTFGVKKTVAGERPSDFSDDMVAIFPTLEKKTITRLNGPSSSSSDKNQETSSAMISNTEMRAKCFETLWHHVLGEPIYHYTPLYEYFEAMPVVSFQDRCAEGKKRLSRNCRFLKIPQPPTKLISAMVPNYASAGSEEVIPSSNKLCVALHGDMLGVELMVTTYAGSNLEDADHSCCRKCRALPQCTFWVRSTSSRECWLKSSFIGYGTQSNRRGMFISEFNGVFLNEL